MAQVFRFIPQITFCCCCTNCSLRSGALIVGWMGLTIFAVPEMILIVLIGTVMKGRPYYVERICAVACVTFELDILNRSSDFPAWLGLIDLAVAVTYCSIVLIMSIFLLVGLYEKRLILVKLWLEVILVVWAVGVVYSSSRIVLVFVFGHGNIWTDFVSSIIHIFIIPGVPLYCIIVVKSYYVEECKSLVRDAYYGKRDVRTMRPIPTTDLGFILRRIPQAWHTCCCTSYTLRLGVLTAGWCSIVGLASYILMITVFITELLIEGHGDQIPEWSVYGKSSYISACVDVALSWTVVVFLLITSVIFLIGLKNGNLKMIKILLGIHVEMWFVFLVVQIMCYVVTSMIFFPRFFIMASFKIVIIQVVYGYWIVMIKSYYVAEYVRQKYGQRIDEVSEMSMVVPLRKKSQLGVSKSTLTLARSDTLFTKSEMELSRTGSIPQIQNTQDKIKELNRKEIGKEKTNFFGGNRKVSQSDPHTIQQDDERIRQMQQQYRKRRSTVQTVKKQKTAFNIQEEGEPERILVQQREKTVEPDRKKPRPDSPQKVQQREKTVEPGMKQQGVDEGPSTWHMSPQREITVERDSKRLGSENSPQRVQQKGETVEPDRKQSRSASPQQVQQREKTVEPGMKQQGADKGPSKWHLWPQREKIAEPDTKQLGRETTSQVRETQQKKIKPEKKEPDKQKEETDKQKSPKSPDEPKKSQGRAKTPHKES